MPVLRSVKNIVRNYTEAEVKVREATSNDPWGPSSTLMSQIADLTYNVVAFAEIMAMIWKRLNDHGKNWRHVYKALTLLEYIIKTGSDKVSQQCKENIFAIRTLKDFQFVEDNKDHGLSVRDKAKGLVTLLTDDERLSNERAKALKAKERFAQSAFGIGSNAQQTQYPVKKPTNLKYPVPPSAGAEAGAASSAIPGPGIQVSSGGSGTPSGLGADYQVALPTTAGEEELQLQLALAMSKEEADSEAKKREKDDLKLKMALEESKKDQSGGSPSHQPSSSGGAWPTPTSQPISDPAPDYALVAPPPPVSNPWTGHPAPSSAFPAAPTPASSSTAAAPTDAWGTPVPATPSISLQVGGALPPLGDTAAPSASPWDTEGPPPAVPPKNLDPWDPALPLSTAGAPADGKQADPWTSGPSLDNGATKDYQQGALADEFDVLVHRKAEPETTKAGPADGPFDFLGMQQTLPPMRAGEELSSTGGGDPKKPEHFLGPNANLVNLDNLVTKPAPSVEYPINPFGGGATPLSTVLADPQHKAQGNPFAAPPLVRPSLNQMSASSSLTFTQQPTLPNPMMPSGAGALPPSTDPALFSGSASQPSAGPAHFASPAVTNPFL